jgi:hypothetical protein
VWPLQLMWSDFTTKMWVYNRHRIFTCQHLTFRSAPSSYRMDMSLDAQCVFFPLAVEIVHCLSRYTMRFSFFTQRVQILLLFLIPLFKLNTLNSFLILFLIWFWMSVVYPAIYLTNFICRVFISLCCYFSVNIHVSMVYVNVRMALMQVYTVFIVQAYQTSTELLSTGAPRRHFSQQVAKRFCRKLPTVKWMSNQPALWTPDIYGLKTETKCLEGESLKAPRAVRQ